MRREDLIRSLNERKVDVPYFYGLFKENCKDIYKGMDIEEFSSWLQAYIMYSKPFLELHRPLMVEHAVHILYDIDKETILGFS